MSDTQTALAAFPTRPYASRESASVFRGNKLLRTLYSGVQKSGNAAIVWDRLDNDGNLVTDLAGVTIEVEGNNIVADWAGTIGNTSTYKTGEKVYTHSHTPTCLIPFGTHGYVYGFCGYEEGEGSSSFKFHIDRPNEKLDVIKKDTIGINRAAKDANYLYCAGLRIEFDGNSNVFKTGVVVIRELPDGTNEYVQLPGMVPVQSGIGGLTYYMFAALASPAISENQVWNQAELISDIAVNSQYLYVAYEAYNRIEVRDKTNNALAATLSIASPHRITLVGNSKLWVSSSGTNTVAEYDLGEGTTATATGRTLTGIHEAADLDTLPDDTALGVLDGNRLNDTRSSATYRLLLYSTATAEQVFSYGRAESYGDDATIYDDKLLLINTKTFEQTPKINSTGGIGFQDNGRAWVIDCGNDDNKLVNLSTKAIEARVGWRGFHYACALVANDWWTMLQDYKQFALDPAVIVSQGVSPSNGSYRATHNFALFRRREYDDKYNRLAQPTKFDNGRTFAFLQHQRPLDPAESVDFHLLLVEKTATQVVYTDQKFPIGYCLNKDQSLAFYESTLNGQVVATGQIGAKLTLWRRAKTGYDGNGVPQFGPRQEVWSIAEVKLEDPITDGGGLVRNTFTDNGVYVTYSTDTTYNKPPGSRGSGYHTGTIAAGDLNLRGRFSPSTKRDYFQGVFPSNDFYVDSNGTHYSGSYYQAIGDTLFTGANCEFYEGKAVFKWKAYNPKGQLRVVGGVTNQSYDPLPPAPAAYATNSTRGDFAQHQDAIIHVSNDEGAHAGSIVMVYKGFNTIWSQSLPLQDYTPPADPSTGLLAGLPKAAPVENGTAGIVIEPANSSGLKLSTGRLETDGTDLLADFDGSLASGTVTLPLDLPAGPWEHDTVLRFTKNAFPQQSGELANIEYLDTNGRLISSTGRREITNDNCPLLFNNAVVGTRSTEAWRPYGYNPTPAKIGVSEDGRPYIDYADFPRYYVDGPADPEADVFAPGAVRLNFQNAGTRGYGINLYQSRLTGATTTTPPSPIRMISTVSGSAPPASQQLVATLSPAALAHYKAGGGVVLRLELPAGVGGNWILLRQPDTGGGSAGPFVDPYDVPTAKRKEVVDANVPAYVETDSAYYGKEFVDEVYGSAVPVCYRCLPTAPANVGGATVWKWFRFDIL